MKNIPLLSRAPRFSHMLLAVLASVVFGGCSPYQKAAPQPEPTVPLTGMVTYRERMALPPDAELTVTLHRKTSDGRMLVAEERASTEGRNVPLPFSIACPAADSSSMSWNRTCSLILKARKAGSPVPTAATVSSAVILSKAIASVSRSSARP